MNLPDGYTARPSGPADLDGVLAVLHARDLLEVGAPDATEGWVADAWRSPRTDRATDTRVVESGDGAIVAYADVTHLDDPEFVNSWAPVHPAHRGRGIGTALLGWIEERAASLPARSLHQHVDAGDREGRALLKGAGFRVVRANLHMLRELGGDPGPSPPTDLPVSIRTMRDGDERAVHHVTEVAFAEHFALTVEPFDAWWAEWSSDPLFDRDLFLVAEHPETGIVAVAADFVDQGVGWIGDLGVLPEWRGRGIAKALLAASFDALRARGVSLVRLNVDAQNETGAADLYRAVGMREHRRFLIYERPSAGDIYERPMSARTTEGKLRLP